MIHFIGIDNSSLDHKVHITSGDGKIEKLFIIENNLNGFNYLHEIVKDIKNPMIGFELPHGPIVEYLKNKGYQVFSLNPLKVKRFKETITVSGNKNDFIDAASIAEYMRKNAAQCRPLLYDSPLIEKLKILFIIHRRMVEEHTRYKNKLHYGIRQYFSLHEQLFTHFACTVQLKMIIKYPTFTALKQVSEKELGEFLSMNSYRNQSGIHAMYKKIIAYDQLISPEVEYAYRIETTMICEILLMLNNKLKDIESGMKCILDTHPLGKIFRSLPGSGPVLSGELLAIFGDNKDRFSNSNQAQCLFGTAPRNYQSGNYHKVLMRKACNKSGRSVLFIYAFTSMRYSSWARSYYERQREKGKTHSVAVRSLSNKWVRIIYRMWKDEIIYQEEKYISSVA